METLQNLLTSDLLHLAIEALREVESDANALLGCKWTMPPLTDEAPITVALNVDGSEATCSLDGEHGFKISGSKSQVSQQLRAKVDEFLAR